MFCLLADIEIRKQTGNRAGLRQAQRGIPAAGGNMEHALWRDLGVSMQGGRVSFDDSAPLAPIRRAITAVPAG